MTWSTEPPKFKRRYSTEGEANPYAVKSRPGSTEVSLLTHDAGGGPADRRGHGGNKVHGADGVIVASTAGVVSRIDLAAGIAAGVRAYVAYFVASPTAFRRRCAKRRRRRYTVVTWPHMRT